MKPEAISALRAYYNYCVEDYFFTEDEKNKHANFINALKVFDGPIYGQAENFFSTNFELHILIKDPFSTFTVEKQSSFQVDITDNVILRTIVLFMLYQDVFNYFLHYVSHINKFKKAHYQDRLRRAFQNLSQGLKRALIHSVMQPRSIMHLLLKYLDLASVGWNGLMVAAASCITFSLSIIYEMISFFYHYIALPQAIRKEGGFMQLIDERYKSDTDRLSMLIINSSQYYETYAVMLFLMFAINTSSFYKAYKDIKQKMIERSHLNKTILPSENLENIKTFLPDLLEQLTFLVPA